jgi:hypothetical protein
MTVALEDTAELAALTGLALAQKTALDGLYRGDFGIENAVDVTIDSRTPEVEARALLADYSVKEISAGQGVIALGDMKIRVRTNEALSATPLTTADTITVRDKKWRIVRVDSEGGRIGGVIYEFICQAAR